MKHLPAATGVFDLLEGPLAERPDAEAVVGRSGRLTYAQLDAVADRAARALHDAGLRRGDRLAVCLPNDLAIVAAFHGAMRLGLIWVGINRVLAAPEKAYVLADSGATLYLTAEPEPDRSGGVRGVTAAEWDAAVEAAEGLTGVTRPDPDAPAAIAYTSGTTGRPKGSVHGQAGLILPGAATVARRGWGGELRKGDSLPLTILNLIVLSTLLTAQAGGTCVLMDAAGTDDIVAWIRRQRVTVWNGPPAQLHTLAADRSIEPDHLATLAEVWVGGGDCPDTLRQAFEARFGLPVVRTYGLTEAPALVSIDDADGDRPSGTSGRPLDHIAVGVEAGELTLGPTTTGPWAGRYQPTLGYWCLPEPSAALLRDGVLHTGDLGRLEHGHLRVTGRQAAVIGRGGANVYPAEVERVLATAPGVQACAVVGVADERLGERVGAAIQLWPDTRADEAAILDHCRHQLAGYKVPEYLVYVDALPRNAMGKVPTPELAALVSVQGHRTAGRHREKGVTRWTSA
jgi:acyl-CoA synthetase (AMP-forming)/AMP-acid ligase II